MRALKAFLAVVLLLALAAAYLFLAPFGPNRETFVEIPPGTGTPAIATMLEHAGIIRSSLSFEALKALKGGTLKAGEYRFDHPIAVSEVYDRLRRGDAYTVTLVIPEGFNIFDIAQAADAAGLARREDFLAAENAHTELIAAWNPSANSLEGYLFPDTYKFGRHITPLQMLTSMVKRFAQTATRLQATQRAGPHPRSPLRDIVIMASLIEREVHLDAERPVVAGVFQNRLAAGMPLQTDPAVVYASQLRGTWTGVIHQSELHSDSPYNTYTHTGLPPGPICNPGLAALQAALHPASTHFLYFVADANGATRFSSTLQDHNTNVALYRRDRP